MKIGLIASSLLWCQLVFGQSTGRIEGVITFAGEIPKSTIADDAGVRHELLEVDSKTRGLRNVVVHLMPAVRAAAERQRPARKLLVDQVDYKFTPRVLAVQEREAVTFTNSDPANHNVRTTALNRTNEFNVFTGVDGKYEHRFVTEPQARPVRLGCDIHPWMRGWIFVFDHPHFAVTDGAGYFEIGDVPAGEHQVHIVQPDIGHREQRKLMVKAGETCKLEVVISRAKDRDAASADGK